ncbi:MAG: hypothetical protein HY908_29470 [Myxococcales bacterium]|nr:hypothetical protein [Myxococcales bacterium]
MPRSFVTACGLFALGLALVACKSEVTESPGSGGTGGTGATGTGATGGSGAGGGGASEGDCASNADCPGTTCVAITPGGFKVCTDTVVEATSCPGSGFDECCDTSECASGLCLTAPLAPYCGGPQPLEYNVCATDACQSDADCPGSVCLPAPMMSYQVRSCFYAQCKVSSDCAAEPGGVCAPVRDACCNGSVGLYCVYPSDGCRSGADCDAGEYCLPDADRAHCEPGFPACPA